MSKFLKKSYLKSHVCKIEDKLILGVTPSKVFDKEKFSNSDEIALLVDRDLFDLSKIDFSASENKLIELLIKKTKKCSHESSFELEKEIQDNKKYIYTCCSNCTLILSRKQVDGPKTKDIQTLKRLKRMITVEEGRVNSLEDSLASAKKYLQELRDIEKNIEETLQNQH